jgi:DNA-binding CsgD family transcriptional regulator
VQHEARTAITAAIAGAISNEVAMATPGFALALPGREGTGLVATVLPLGRGKRRDTLGSCAAAVFVQDPSLAPVLPGRAFARLYGLTDAELRVLLAMAPGLGVKEAAAMLGIGEVTARTHLQHIFAKTGTSKQTQLLNLLKNSTPPVRMA